MSKRQDELWRLWAQLSRAYLRALARGEFKRAAAILADMQALEAQLEALELGR